jgi:uncharacterized protein (TIGR03435 family)
MKLFALTMISLLFTQVPAPAPPEFEVASVKPNRPTSGAGVTGDCHGADSSFAPGDVGASIPHGRCVITAARLSHLIAIAYHLEMNRISGGPEFVWGAERYDIEGKAENADATHAQLIEMLRNLIADRFKLKFHLESREVSGHAVIIAKNGPKLKESKSSENRASVRILGASINKFNAIDGKNSNLNTVIAERTTMAEFVKTLSNLPGSDPFVDKTGLTGVYDITLSWEPGEPLDSVLQQQLGLRLESQKVPLDYFIIDSAQKPAGN